MDYLQSRNEVDPARVICTGSSGGGMQTMFLGALDDRLAGAVPVCSVGSYPAYIGATACVCEIATDVMRYTDQWEILGPPRAATAFVHQRFARHRSLSSQAHALDVGQDPPTRLSPLRRRE